MLGRCRAAVRGQDPLDPVDPLDPGMGSLFRTLGVFCDRSETLTPPETGFAQKVFFLGEKKPPEAAAHRRTGLFVIKKCFLFKKCSFLVEKNRRGPKNRAFCHKNAFSAQKVLFFCEKNRGFFS